MSGTNGLNRQSINLSFLSNLKWWQATIMLAVLLGGLALIAHEGGNVDIGLQLQLQELRDEINIPVNSTVSAMIKQASYIVTAHSGYTCYFNGSAESGGKLENYALNASTVIANLFGNFSGGSVFIKNVFSPYILSVGASIPSNCSLISDGAVLKRGDGTADMNVLNLNGVSNVTISGLEIDGNNKSNTGTNQYKNHGIYLSLCTSVTIEKCYIHDTVYDGILDWTGNPPYGSDLVTITHNRIENSNNYEMIGVSAKRFEISFNTLLNRQTAVTTMYDIHVDEEYNNTVGKVLGNTIDSYDEYAVHLTSTYGPAGTVTISNNNIINNVTGIYLEASAGNCTVSMNTIQNCTSGGIFVLSNSNSITSNIIPSLQLGSNKNAIDIRGNSNTVSQNTISNTGGAAYSAGIFISGQANTISENTIYNAYNGISVGGNLNSLVGNTVSIASNNGLYFGVAALTTVTGGALYRCNSAAVMLDNANQTTLQGMTIDLINNLGVYVLAPDNNTKILGGSICDTRTQGILLQAGSYNCLIAETTFRNNSAPLSNSATGTVVKSNPGFITENTVLNMANSTATTFVFNHGLAASANSVQCSFDLTIQYSWTWTSTSTQVTVTVTPAAGQTLPATYHILSAELHYIP
jgi:parallel beta-helix repeat protein